MRLTSSDYFARPLRARFAMANKGNQKLLPNSAVLYLSRRRLRRQTYCDPRRRVAGKT